MLTDNEEKMPNKQLFNIVFEGRPLPGIPLEKGIDGLARLLRRKPDDIAHLFNKRPKVLKRGVPKETALKYRQALQNAGLACHITNAGSSSPLNTEKIKKNSAPDVDSAFPPPAAADYERDKKNTINTRGKMESKAEESGSPPDHWTEYWQGAVILSLLTTALAFFSANANSPLLAGLLSTVIFFISYPCTRFILKVMKNSLFFIIAASILLGGGPLVFFMCYGIVLGFARLVNIKRFFKVYLTASIILVVAGTIIAPSSMSDEKGSFTDSRDGKVYKTVKIGEQLWMAENLAYKTDSGCFALGDVGKYGCLYNFEAAQEACPEGWHLPTDEEWMILIDFLGGKEVAGENLKNRKGWEPYHNRNYGNNKSGFSALPAGFKKPRKSAKLDRKIKAYFFSDTANIYILYYSDVDISIQQGLLSSDYAYSVRCIRDY